MFNWSTFLLYAVVMTITPGPNNIMVLAAAGKYGFKKALEYSTGLFVAYFVIMLLTSYFNLMFFNLIPKIQPIVQIFGAAFMVYLAFKIMLPKKELDQENSGIDEEQLTAAKTPSLFLTAVSLQIVNPKGILYAITVISTFIIPFYQSNLAFILFAILLAFISFLSNITWALFGSLFNAFLTRYQKPFNVMMGLLLIYSAISVLDITQYF